MVKKYDSLLNFTVQLNWLIVKQFHRTVKLINMIDLPQMKILNNNTPFLKTQKSDFPVL